MSLESRLTHSIYDGTGPNCISNLLMSPTHHLFDPRSYFVYTDKRGDFSHICYSEETSNVIDFMNSFIGVVHSCFCLFNLIGLAMKSFTYLKAPNESYYLAESAINETFAKKSKAQKWPMINMAAMSQFPAKIEPSKEELEAIKSLKLTDLLTVWRDVGKSHSQYEKINTDLHDWLTKIVPHPEKYNYISQSVAPEAAAKLKQTLLLIIHQLNTQKNLTPNSKEHFLLRIFDKSFFSPEELLTHSPSNKGKLEHRVTCSPTWIEVTEQIYKELKGSGTAEQRLLQYLQQIKEDIVHETSEELQRNSRRINIDWHGLNIGRTLIGKEIALDCSNLKFDSTFKLGFLTKLAWKYPALYFFYRHCSPQGLKDRLIKKISLDHLGAHTNGLDQQLMKFLEPFAIEHVKASHINTENESFDSATYVMMTFFDKDPTAQKYHFNHLGAQGLLNLIGIPV